MKVTDFLAPDMIVSDLKSDTKTGILSELAFHLSNHMSGVDGNVLKKVLEERELLASTAIGDGIAIPHGKLDAVGRLVGALGRPVEGIEFQSIDGTPPH